MQSALIHFNSEQKKRLTRRARKRGKSFSQEVRDAVDLYLTIPVETEEELRGLSLAARTSAGRSLKHLDSAIAAVARTLKQARNGR